MRSKVDLPAAYNGILLSPDASRFRNANMKAIVLTYDRNRAVTEHMILKYEQLWPDHPFTFRIPYQELAGPANPRHEYIRTPPEIRPTVLQLIAGLDDNEWIYWCVDDKYPIELVLPKIRTFVA